MNDHDMAEQKMLTINLKEAHHPGMPDASIAGIAKANELTVITGNTEHLAPFGINAATLGEATQSI